MDARPHVGGRPRPLPLSPAQIVAVGLVVASIGGAAWLVGQRPEATEAPLLDGTALDAAQLAAVEAALDRAGLTDYRTESGQVWVPRSRQSAYKRAIVDGDALPKPWGTRFQQAISEGGMWVSPAARAESLKVARQDELALVLASMPGIERAAVMYDEARGEGFRQESIKTASVGIRSAAGMELDVVRAHGIRVLVAASVAGLEPEHVAVTDLSSGRVFAGPLRDDASGTGLDEALARRMAVEGAIAGRLRQTLEFVPGVIVAVAVETAARAPAVAPVAGPSTVGSAVPSAAANAPAEVAAAAPADAPAPPAADAAPNAVRVTVSLPDSYLDAAVAATRARARRDSADPPAGDAVARGEIDRVRDLVTRSLPGIADPARLEVLVTSHPSPATAPGRGLARAADAASTGQREAAEGEMPAAATADGSVPLAREHWMTLASILVGALAGALWWAGSRGRTMGGRRGGDAATDDDDDLGPAARGDALDRRLAA